MPLIDRLYLQLPQRCINLLQGARLSNKESYDACKTGKKERTTTFGQQRKKKSYPLFFVSPTTSHQPSSRFWGKNGAMTGPGCSSSRSRSTITFTGAPLKILNHTYHATVLCCKQHVNKSPVNLRCDIVLVVHFKWQFNVGITITKPGHILKRNTGS